MAARFTNCLLLVATLAAASCDAKSVSQQAPESGALVEAKETEEAGKMDGLDLEDLCQKWAHVPEEQKSEWELIYRSGERRLAPIDFRMEYIFHKNGECQWYFLSPDDNHRFKPGRWKIDPSDKNTLVIEKGEKTVAYKVLELTHDTLRMKQSAPAIEEK